MRPRWTPARNVLAALGILTLALGCKREVDTFLIVRAELEGTTSVPLTTLRVTVRDAASRTDSHTFGVGGRPTLLPTTFSLQLPRDLVSPLWVEVLALSEGEMIGMAQARAQGVLESLMISPGSRHQLTISLHCVQGCIADGGAAHGGSPLDAAASDAPRAADARGLCGNGQVEDGELCDPAIPPGRWGACPPPDCDDGLACTVDVAVGSGCGQTCQHTALTVSRTGDGCCPNGGTAASDGDCSPSCGNGVVEGPAAGRAGETCDLGIAPGQDGACPAGDECDDRNPCTTDRLISAGTCSAVCVSQPVLDTVAADGCCAPGSSSGSDPDCPAVCGNGRKDPGESCDRGAAPGSPEACPQSCDDNNPCTRDVVQGSGCQVLCRNLAITEPDPGDRCCPPGADRSLDPDCPAKCGNMIVEPGEACDKGLVAPAAGACPTSCASSSPACLTRRLEGRGDDCTARCTEDLGPALCSPTVDGCCPEHCTAANDPDCSTSCGNGAVEAGETCDTAIPAGSPGGCPTSCSDSSTCTTDVLVSRGTCNARCAYLPVTTSLSGDGCCPAGASTVQDSDCPAQCGDGLVGGPSETCDKGIPDGKPGACPRSCPTPPSACLRATLVGDADGCTSRCQTETVKACAHGDGCCPAGCDRQTDDDCMAVCGNGVVEPGEICDRSVSAGKPGVCPAVCNDNDACTVDTTLGRVSDCSRECRNERISACRSGDGCCPAGCLPQQDRDCLPTCGNGVVEAGETCDPPSKCPSVCPDDKDPCTDRRLLGDATTCTAVCVYPPILTCSGSTSDKCCPTSCLTPVDVDCAAPPPVSVSKY